MKKLNLFNRSGMGPDVTSRKGRHSLDPILSRLCLVSLICLCMLTVGSGNVWGGETTYTSRTSAGSNTKIIDTSDAWTASLGASYNASGAYWACNQATRTFTITCTSISDPITSIVVSGKRNKNYTYSISATVGGSTFGSTYSHAASSGDYTTNTLSNGSGMSGTVVLTITSAGAGSGGGSIWVSSIVVTTSSSTYTVSFSVNPDGYGSVSPTSVTGVSSGTSISTSSNTLTVGSTPVTATAASQTAQYTYAFSNWTKSDGTALPATVTGNLAVRANFTRTLRSYSVTTTLTNVSVKAGSTAFPATLNYGGTFSTTIAAADGYVLPSTITVSGASHTWNSSTGALTLSSVTGNVSVTIVGATVHTVTWSVNGNTSTISPTTNVPYNTTVSMPTPSVPGECSGSTFMGWTTSANASYSGDSAPSPLYNGTSPAITGDITFYAVFADEE